MSFSARSSVTSNNVSVSVESVQKLHSFCIRGRFQSSRQSHRDRDGYLPWSITPRAIELDKRVVSGFFVSKQPQDCLALRLVRLFRQHLPIAIEVLLVNELFHLHHPCWR